MNKEAILSGIGGFFLGAVFLAVLGGYGSSRGPSMMGSGFYGAPLGQFPASVGDALDRQFIDQMIPHHRVAIDAAGIALQKSEHEEIKSLAQNIARDQAAEIAEMRGLYRSWYGTEPPEFFGAGMGGFMAGGAMSDMMRGGMMQRFDASLLESPETNVPFDQRFIEQMIPHHQMAIIMANMLLERTTRSELKELARRIIEGQSAEVKQMREWYEKWYRASQ